MGVRQVAQECVQHLVVELVLADAQVLAQDAQAVEELVHTDVQVDAQAVEGLVHMDVQVDVQVDVVVTVEVHAQEQNFVVEDAQGVAQVVTHMVLGQR